MNTSNKRTGAWEDLPEEVQIALGIVMNYLWDDELRDYSCDPRSGHLFPQLVTIEAWLSGERLTVEEFAGEVDEV